MRRLFHTLWVLALVPVLGGSIARAAPDGADTKKAEARDEKKADSKDKAEKKAEPKPKVAVFRLRSGLTEAPTEDSFPFGSGTPVTLRELVARMKKAKDDPAVKAVVIFHEEGGIGSAQTEELRQAMAGLRAAGKDIYVHADSLSMREYVLVSGASRVSVVPTGDVWVTGLYGESMYLRGLFDMIGVKPDFLTCGAYKSAAEMFMRTGPSPEAEKMQNWLLDSIFETQTGLIAQGRKVDAAKVREWIDNGPYSAAKAKELGLIDAVEHRKAFERMLKGKYGQEVTFDYKYGRKKPPSVDFSSPFGFLKLWSDMLSEAQKKKTGKNAVAIVYVDGPIMLGTNSRGSLFGAEGGAYSTDIRKALDEVAKDDSVKAVVLRVNSPGGSATASEIILAATKRVKAKKPFVVSMGDVAGSGGYYVACGSETIFADAATITGSIGVVGGKLATNDAWKKVGVTFKGYQRGKHADMLSSAKVFSPEERERMQAWMDEIYGVFKGHVTAVRGGRLKKPIDELAGGRVYTGKQALELGLVDKLGTLEDTVAFIAAKADLKDYDVRVVPQPKNFIEQLVEESTGGKDDPHSLDVFARRPVALGPSVSLVEMALPHLRHLDPQRVAAITRALRGLETLQREGAVLLMPEVFLPR